jgi:tRNA-dihydrouridine synthase
MDGITDLAMRVWISLTSKPDFAFTPFFRVTAEFPFGRIPKLLWHGAEGRLGYRVRTQLMGSCPDTLARFAVHFLESQEAIDINMGCPAPQVVGHKGGSALIRCHLELKHFMDRLFSLVPPDRVSIKTRLGFESPDEFEDLASLIARYPILELSLHGRTRPQRYRGRSDWQRIGQAAAKINKPMVGSGDIVSHLSLQHAMATAPQVSRFMIGRGLLRNPWLIHEIRDGKPVSLSPTTLQAALKVYLRLNALLSPKKHSTQTGFDWHPNHIIDLILESQSLHPNSRQADFWTSLLDKLNGMASDNSNLNQSAVNLSRLKMLWSYLFTSLPVTFSDVSILRSKSEDDFFGAFAAMVTKHNQSMQAESSRSLGSQEAEVTLNHNPGWDWRFAGEARTV